MVFDRDRTETGNVNHTVKYNSSRSGNERRVEVVQQLRARRLPLFPSSKEVTPRVPLFPSPFTPWTPLEIPLSLRTAGTPLPLPLHTVGTPLPIPSNPRVFFEDHSLRQPQAPGPHVAAQVVQRAATMAALRTDRTHLC